MQPEQAFERLDHMFRWSVAVVYLAWVTEDCGR